MVQQTLMSRWFPATGDLVIIPRAKKRVDKGLSNRRSYGIILQQSINTDLQGAWWDVLSEGGVERIHLQDISPLCDKEGLCLKVVLK